MEESGERKIINLAEERRKRSLPEVVNEDQRELLALAQTVRKQFESTPPREEDTPALVGMLLGQFHRFTDEEIQQKLHDHRKNAHVHDPLYMYVVSLEYLRRHNKP